MSHVQIEPGGRAAALQGVRRIGCVSFLNARPLIEGLEEIAESSGVRLQFDVPSQLLGRLESGAVDVALCPVIDYYRSSVALEIVPVGQIGCHGSTMTVKLVSRVPIDRIDEVHADTDSHTSVALLQMVLHDRCGYRPLVKPYDARHQPLAAASTTPQSVLLIGDKVVRDAPSREVFPYQIDLGQAWYELTGLPFVFAIWMAREGTDLGDLPEMLDACRLENVQRIDQIVRRHAANHQWPIDLARHYLGNLLKFGVGPSQLEAIEHFARRAFELDLIPAPTPLRLRGAKLLR